MLTEAELLTVLYVIINIFAFAPRNMRQADGLYIAICFKTLFKEKVLLCV